MTHDDCPQEPAPPYPGKFTRNNPNCTRLTKNAYMRKMIKDWIDHFEGNEKYENTYLCHKTLYLKHHMRVFISKMFQLKHLQELLVSVEAALGIPVQQRDEDDLYYEENSYLPMDEGCDDDTMEQTARES